MKTYPNEIGTGILGAYIAASKVTKRIVILHAGKGCVENIINKGLALYGVDYLLFNRYITALENEDIIFGGINKINQILLKTSSVSGKYVILSNYIPELIGDDIESVISYEEDVVYVGIKPATNIYYGFDFFIYKYLEYLYKGKNYVYKKERISVNIWGFYPVIDRYYEGNCTELCRVLEGVGITVNYFSGQYMDPDRSMEMLSNTAANIIFGFRNPVADFLNRYKGIPVIYFENYPIGLRQTEDFLNTLCINGLCEKEIKEKFIYTEKKYYFTKVSSEMRKLDSIIGKKVAIFVDLLYRESLKLFCEELCLIPSIISSIDIKEDFDFIFGSEYCMKYIKKNKYNKTKLIVIANPIITETMLYSLPIIGCRGALVLIDKILRELPV